MVGEVLRPHGLNGEMKVYPITDDPHRFRQLREVFLLKDESEQAFQVQNVRVQEFVFLTLKGIDSRDEAEKYRSWQVRINRSDVPPLEDGWYYFELEGMQVYEGVTFLGTLTQVIETGANDVYVVDGPHGQICVPALKSVVQKVDVPGRRMDVILPPGLWEGER